MPFATGSGIWAGQGVSDPWRGVEYLRRRVSLCEGLGQGTDAVKEMAGTLALWVANGRRHSPHGQILIRLVRRTETMVGRSMARDFYYVSLCIIYDVCRAPLMDLFVFTIAQTALCCFRSILGALTVLSPFRPFSLQSQALVATRPLFLRPVKARSAISRDQTCMRHTQQKHPCII